MKFESLKKSRNKKKDFLSSEEQMVFSKAKSAKAWAGRPENPHRNWGHRGPSMQRPRMPAALRCRSLTSLASKAT